MATEDALSRAVFGNDVVWSCLVFENEEVHLVRVREDSSTGRFACEVCLNGPTRPLGGHTTRVADAKRKARVYVREHSLCPEELLRTADRQSTVTMALRVIETAVHACHNEQDV